MSVRKSSFRWCMTIGALALLGVAVFYGFSYIGVSSVVRTANFTPFYAESIRALWIGYCLQAGLLGVLFLVAAARSHWISRPLVVICGLLPLAQAVLAFSFTRSLIAMALLSIAALFVLLGAMLWPGPPVVMTNVTPVPVPAPQPASLNPNVPGPPP
jgi:hypothetical protein